MHVRIVIQWALSVTNAELFVSVFSLSNRSVHQQTERERQIGRSIRLVIANRRCRVEMYAIYIFRSTRDYQLKNSTRDTIVINESTRQPRSDYRRLIISSWSEDSHDWQACLPSVLTINNPSLHNASQQRSSSFVFRCLLCSDWRLNKFDDSRGLTRSVLIIVCFVHRRRRQASAWTKLVHHGLVLGTTERWIRRNSLVTCFSHGCWRSGRFYTSNGISRWTSVAYQRCRAFLWDQSKQSQQQFRCSQRGEFSHRTSSPPQATSDSLVVPKWPFASKFLKATRLATDVHQ